MEESEVGNKAAETAADNAAKIANNRSWQIITIAVISYLIFLVSASLGVWVSFKNNGYNSQSMEDGVKGGSLTLLILAVLAPIIYLTLSYVYVTKAQADVDAIKLSRKSILIIMMVTYALMIITSSFGIWLTNTNQNWASNDQENAVQITFIIVLVVSLMLPFFYGLFYYRESICRQILKNK